MKFVPNTEIGLLAIWSDDSPKNIEFVNEYNLVKIMNAGQVIFWGTGGDGRFNVQVRLNPENDLERNEKDLIEFQGHNYKFTTTTSTAYVGSPELMGKYTKQGLADHQVLQLPNMQPGTYAVSIYFLYDSEASKAVEGLSTLKTVEYYKDHPGFDKTGYIVCIKSVNENEEFKICSEIPTFG